MSLRQKFLSLLIPYYRIESGMWVLISSLPNVYGQLQPREVTVFHEVDLGDGLIPMSSANQNAVYYGLLREKMRLIEPELWLHTYVVTKEEYQDWGDGSEPEE